ncbi:MAG: hypothetical protein KKA16_13375 [Alphaproteobacteria bacterium]|nr:hypothetical protein [Alphaproteobacteria bacterium]MBU2380595.1 hypothetical protein [Alphaproteobacteria bacterium]
MFRLSALIAAAVAFAGPVAAQTTMLPGDTVQRDLTASDPTLEDGSHYQCFSVRTVQGEGLQIDMTSDAFDTYLTIGTGACATPTNADADDDGGEGTNSRLTRVGDGERLIIRANSLQGGKTGAYRLTVTQVSRPGQAAVAAPASGGDGTSIGVGQTARGSLTASDPTLSDGSHYECFQIQTRPGQTLQIEQASTDFDSYLSIGGGRCDAMSDVVSDDDGGDGLNSRLTFEGDGSLLTVRANSVGRGETGQYQLTVSETGGAYSTVDMSTLGASRPTTLPRVTSEWDLQPDTCVAAYAAMTTMRDENTSPAEHGNVAAINYGSRIGTLIPLTDQTDAGMDAMGFLLMNFKSMALVGAIGVAPNGEPNGGRPLAEYLTALGNCDRQYGFTPVTAY